jgi:DMSO reductase family type II enzyme heme b subunit
MNRDTVIMRILSTAAVIAYYLIFNAHMALAEDFISGQGKTLYKKHCEVCHGVKGGGDGPAARYLFPKPRDLTAGLFKVRSTSTGEPPTDDDILFIIRNGMPGSAMPSLGELTKDEMKMIAEYVKELGEIIDDPESVIQPGTPPEVTTGLISKGKEIYDRMKCWECHGYEGKGDGPKAKDLKDDWKQPAPPNVFTMGIYKGGGTPSDVYLRFTAGMDGSPMPSYEDVLKDEERWALVFYTLSLAGPDVAKQPTSGQIVAKKISENLPSDPENDLWSGVTTFKIPLMLLWQEPDSPQRLIHVKALYNEREIAFLVEWNDATKNAFLDLDVFRDGAALQFPVKKGAKPSFWMGDDRKNEGMVNIWFWKADAQELIDTGMQSSHQSPVENLVAGGFGTLTFKDSGYQQVFGKGIWKEGKWSVVLKRNLVITPGNAKFSSGELTPISFGVWDGGEAEVDGRKAISTWYYVSLEAK